MEKFKLDIYLKETGNVFSEIEPINTQNRDAILRNIVEILGLKNNSELFVEIEKSLSSKDFDEDYIQDISKIFEIFNFKATNYLFLVWNVNDIDKIKANVLIENWSFLWYADSDDAVIVFDDENNKILLITHYGRIFFN